MKKKNVKKILEVLKNLQNGEIKYPKYGICLNIYLVLDCTDCISDFLEEGTIEFFGEDTNYPIEGNSLLHAKNKDKWNPDTEFGRKRLKFVDDLIKFGEGKL